MGIDDRVGSLEKGKDGDLAIFSAHPLSIYAIPEYTVVDGVIRFNRSTDAADMRLDVDPEETTPTFYEWHQHDHEHDGCMEGTHNH